MNGNDMQIEFMGFDPGYEMKTFTATVAEKLHFSAPSDAAMKLAVKKCKGAVQASCRIASQAGLFIAEVASDNPVRALQQIELKIRSQLEAWKNRRFDNKSESVAEG
jgi:hypothetical protein